MHAIEIDFITITAESGMTPCGRQVQVTVDAPFPDEMQGLMSIFVTIRPWGLPNVFPGQFRTCQITGQGAIKVNGVGALKSLRACYAL
jgi:hypothetical protein